MVARIARLVVKSILAEHDRPNATAVWAALGADEAEVRRMEPHMLMALGPVHSS